MKFFSSSFVLICLTIPLTLSLFFNNKEIEDNLMCMRNNLFDNNNISPINTSNKKTIFEKCYFKTADVVLILVMQYFKTFENCWHKILDIFYILVVKYYDLLKVLISHLTTYPNDIIFSITSIILLYIVRLIIKDII